MLTRRRFAALLLGTAAVPARAAPTPSGWLSVEVNDGWTYVFVGDENIGRTPVADFPLAPGRHTIRLVRRDVPFDRWYPVEIVSTQRTTLVLPYAELVPRAVPADGLLTVSSLPRTQVFIDGEFVRYTPVFQREVPAGVHTVLLVTEDGRRKSFRVEVRGGEETRRVWLFDEERWSEP